MGATVRLGAQGRIVLPVDVRAALGLQPGDELSLTVEERRLILQTRLEAAERLRGLARTGAGRSLVDELLADRGRKHRNDGARRLRPPG
ncbi:MAG: AbrB/MazE/SpoVT family DNA-binding domain-containing protein [Actinomycetota bacterium]|nr:AbrB/MazE/SpoVT family DNA-binding domain-containing protein [Actinomycetota bacterium]